MKRSVAAALNALLVAASMSVGALAQDPADDAPPLDARLGGSLTSFDAAYGPAPADDGLAFLGTTYEDVPGTSSVMVSDHEGVVTGITLFAPRPNGEGWTANDANGSNWTIQGAFDAAEEFIPRDGVLGAPSDPRLGVVRAVGTSTALAQQVPESVYAWVDNSYVVGEFSVVLMLDETDAKVSSVFVELEVEDPLPE